MVMSITNARAVQPFVPVGGLVTKKNERNLRPNGVSQSAALEGATEVDLGTQIYHIDLVSVYVDGFRMLNTTLDFGATYDSYTISGSKVLFKAPVTGNVFVFMQLPFKDQVPKENILEVNNVQGAKTSNKTAQTMLGGTFCSPIILTLPVHGDVCLTDDRLSIVYLPNQGYEGFDAFSYTVITDRGQVADPKCVNIKVGNPKVTRP